MVDVGGRPTKMTEETVKKLEEGFLKGLNDTEACFYANISRQTFYTYCKENPEFLDRKVELMEAVRTKAKLNLEQAIQSGDKPLSQWYLERRDKDFKNKTDITSDDKPIPILNVLNVPSNDSDQKDKPAN